MKYRINGNVVAVGSVTNTRLGTRKIVINLLTEIHKVTSVTPDLGWEMDNWLDLTSAGADVEQEICGKELIKDAVELLSSWAPKGLGFYLDGEDIGWWEDAE